MRNHRLEIDVVNLASKRDSWGQRGYLRYLCQSGKHSPSRNLGRKKAGMMTPEPPDEIADLCTITRWIAGLGGFMGRKGDGHPGLIAVWRG